MTEKVVKSIRMNPTVYERLSAVAKEGGLDTGAALESLLNAWDVQAAKGQVPERAADVADFDAAVQAVQKAFLRSLELAQNAENRARVDYQAQLDAMSGTIARLQTEVRNGDTMYHTLLGEAQRLKNELEAAHARIAELEKGRKLEGLLEALADRLDAPMLPESKPKRGKAKGKKLTADNPDAAAELAREHPGEPVEVGGKGTLVFEG